MYIYIKPINKHSRKHSVPQTMCSGKKLPLSKARELLLGYHTVHSNRLFHQP